MKNSWITILLLMATTVVIAQPAQKTLVKSFNLQGNNAVVLNLGENVKVEQWEKDVIRVTMDIKVVNGNDNTLKLLVESGRYTLKFDLKDEHWYVNAPFLHKPAKVNSTTYTEVISYTVYAPAGVAVTLEKPETKPSPVLEPVKENAAKTNSL